MKLIDLFDDPSKWIQGTKAKDANGTPVDPKSEPAVQWCLVGGIDKCYRGTDQFFHVQSRIMREVRRFIPAWNDAPTRTFEDVRQLIESLDI